VTAAFLAALAFAIGTRLWIDARQRRHVLLRRDEVPEPFRGTVPLEAHRKAADYTLARSRLSRIALAVDTAALLGWTLLGGLEALQGRLPGVALLLGVAAIDGAVRLPLSVASVFGVERRFGFNRTTPRLFCIDLLKSALVGGTLLAALGASALWLMRKSPDFWWLPLWAVSMLLGLFLPHFLLPLFWKLKPLPEGSLSGRIRSLLERVRFPVRGLFVLDGSRRSSHSNAFFTGFGRQKKVVLFDTLTSQLKEEEIEAVLAHELGHFRLRHLRKAAAASAVFSFLALALGAWLLRQAWFFEGLGVATATPWAGLVLLSKTAGLFGFPLRPLLLARSRRREFEADAFAAEHAGKEAMERALVSIYRENASTLTPDRLWVIWHASHPPPLARIARLRGC